MVVSMPRKGLTSDEPPDMVRVQLKENDIRSYRRRDVEEVLAQTPGAFIVGEQGDPSMEDGEPKAKASALNKARSTRSASSKPAGAAPPAGQAETKAAPAAEGKGE